MADKVYGLPEGHPMAVHHNHNHVVHIAFGLFTIVREEVLENVEIENLRDLNDPV